MIRFVEFCAGVGGFSLAATWMGWDVVGQVEIDPWCRLVLAKHWPDALRLEDLRNVHGDEWGAVDVVAGGIPCQPFSVAGKQAGAADDRHLWPEVARILAVMRPKVCVVENVSGFVRLALDDVLADLEAQGYTCGTVVLPACGIGAPHRRERVWVVAHANGHRRVNVSSREGRAEGQALNAVVASREQWTHSPRRLVERSCSRIEQDAPDAHDGRRESSHEGKWAISEFDSLSHVPDPERGEGGQRSDADVLGGWQREAEQTGVGRGSADVDDTEGTRRGLRDAQHVGALAGDEHTSGDASSGGRETIANATSECGTEQHERPLESREQAPRGRDDLRPGIQGGRRNPETQSSVGVENDGLPGRLPLTGLPDLYRGASARTRFARLGMAGGWDEGASLQTAGSAVAGSFPQDPRWQGNPLAAFGPDWEDGVPRVVTHCADRTHKLKALGNALVPQIPYLIFQALEASSS